MEVCSLEVAFFLPNRLQTFATIRNEDLAAKLYRWRVIMFVKVVWFDRRNILERCSEDDLS